MTDVGARVAGPDVADFEEPSVVRLDHREATVRADPLEARGENDARRCTSRAFGRFALCAVRRPALLVVEGRAARGPIGVVCVAPNDGVILQILGHTRNERVLANHRHYGLLAGRAHQIGQPISAVEGRLRLRLRLLAQGGRKRAK